MTEDLIARRVRTAVEGFAPPYPHDAVVARLAAPRRVQPHRIGRAHVTTPTLAALALAIVAASAAVAVPNVFPDRVLRALDRVGVHLRGKTMVPLESREVSLDEARAAAGFPVLVPAHVRIVRILLSTDERHHRSFVGMVIQDDRGSQLDLEQSRAVPEPHARRTAPSYQINADGRVFKIYPVRWTLGDTQLMVTPYDAKSRAFIERMRRARFSDRAAP